MRTRTWMGLALGLLCGPAWSLADLSITPYQWINARITVTGWPKSGEGFHRLELWRHGRSKPEYRFNTRELKDYKPGAVVEYRLTRFLPLGTYYAKLVGKGGTVRTNPINVTRGIQTALRGSASPNSSDPAVLPVLQFRGKGEQNAAQDRDPEALGQLLPLWPMGGNAARPLAFRWQLQPGKKRSYHFYLFDQDQVVWKTVTHRTSLAYEGPPLKPGKTYYWLVGAASDCGFYELRGLPSFQAPR